MLEEPERAKPVVQRDHNGVMLDHPPRVPSVTSAGHQPTTMHEHQHRQPFTGPKRSGHVEEQAILSAGDTTLKIRLRTSLTRPSGITDTLPRLGRLWRTPSQRANWRCGVRDCLETSMVRGHNSLQPTITGLNAGLIRRGTTGHPDYERGHCRENACHTDKDPGASRASRRQPGVSASTPGTVRRVRRDRERPGECR